MKVFIVVLMTILLPLQAAWSAAAVFCQHENRTAWHWGHHQHVADALCQQSAQQNQHAELQTDPQKNNSFQQDPATNKNSKPYAATVINHSDHLTGNQPVLNPAPQGILMQSYEQDSKSILYALIPTLYQSPVLEQPKPPVWPA